MKLLKGMKDMYFDSIKKYDFIVEKGIEVFERYGFSRIQTPLLEEYNLFKRSAGDETDVVSKEMYDFIDKGNRHIALRPEGTAGVVRAYLENKIYKQYATTKWYYYGTMYRYEAPQKGRFREFSQLGVECFGIRSAMLDASIIKMGLDFLYELGLKDLVVEINSLGNINSRQKYIEKLKEYLLENFDSLSENSKIRVHKNTLRVLDSKEDDDIVAKAPKLYDYFDDESRQYFEELKENLELYGVKYIVNDKLVRGLDYYSDTVFEIKSNDLGSQSTVLAGGRYDKLLTQLADVNIPAIGFAAGIDRLAILLNDSFINKPKKKVYIIYVDSTKKELFRVLEELKNLDIQIDYECSSKSLNAQLKKANKLGVDKVILLLEDELKDNKVSIKDFSTAKQVLVSIDKIKEVI